MVNKKKTVEELLEKALVPERKQPYGIPDNWIWTNVKSINKNKKRTIQPNKFSDEIFELYSVPSYPEKSPETIKGKEIGSSKQIVDIDNVLLCKINPRINRVWKVVESNSKLRQLASTEWMVIENSQLNSNYLLNYFKSPYFRKVINSNVSGVGGSLTRARPKEIENYLIPLPPFKEQKRIADKVERLLNKIEEVEQLIEEAKESFELRYAAIIRKILEEDLQENEKYNQLSDIYTIFGGGTPSKSKKSYWDGDIPWISAKDMKTTYITETRDYISEDGLNNSSAKLANKDAVALVVRSGILRKTLPVALLQKKATVNQDLKIFDSGNKWLNKYLLWYIKGYEKDLLIEYSKSGTTVNSIDFTRFKTHKLYLPSSIEEIKYKVTRIEKAINMEEKSYSNLEMENLINQIKKSILSKAFKGQLGTNNSTEKNAIEVFKEVL